MIKTLNIAIVAINKKGKQQALKLKKALNAAIYMPSKGRLSGLTKRLFSEYDAIIFCMALGVAVRMIAPYIKNKHTDPAVVSVDGAGRFAISALSGHEGGANNLAVQASNILGAQAVVTTASEVSKNIIIGIGCRRGVTKEEVIAAIKYGLRRSAVSMKDIMYIATIDIKKDEAGLKDACFQLGIPLKVISSELVKRFNGPYSRSDFVKRKIGVEGVSEPCALLAARNPKLILGKTKINKVTVAITKEA